MSGVFHNSVKKCLSNSLDEVSPATILMLFFSGQSVNLLAQVFVDFSALLLLFLHLSVAVRKYGLGGRAVKSTPSSPLVVILGPKMLHLL